MPPQIPNIFTRSFRSLKEVSLNGKGLLDDASSNNALVKDRDAVRPRRFPIDVDWLKQHELLLSVGLEPKLKTKECTDRNNEEMKRNGYQWLKSISLVASDIVLSTAWKKKM
jgi:hypothetical protein